MRVAIVTLNSINYGNRLQNYAIYHFLEKMSVDAKNLYIDDLRKYIVIKRVNSLPRKIAKMIIPMSLLKWYRKKSIESLYGEKKHIFEEFTTCYMDSEYITLYHDNDIKKYVGQNEYSHFLAGSDQIWNPDFAGDDYFFLDFVEPHKRIAFAASIGYETLPDDVLTQYAEYWKNMRYISVREQSAADLIEKTVGRKADVFLDPTMLLTQREWKEISEKPDFKLPERYILCLFLGNAPEDTIIDYQKAHEMEVIRLNDKTYTDYYLTGPSEFIYLIEHADLILTDSFHCTVFSIIFHKDFYVFKREDGTENNMFTRLQNLLDKLGFQDRVQKRDGTIQRDKIIAERFAGSDAVMRAEQQRVTRIMTDLLQPVLDETLLN